MCSGKRPSTRGEQDSTTVLWFPLASFAVGRGSISLTGVRRPNFRFNFSQWVLTSLVARSSLVYVRAYNERSERNCVRLDATAVSSSFRQLGSR